MIAVDPVTSPAWWQQVLAAVASAGAVAAAGAGALKWLPGLRTWWTHRQEARKAERKADVAEVLKPVVEKLEGIDRKVDARHADNTRELDEVKRQLGAIHRRIDDHMVEEREQGRRDRAELREWLQMAFDLHK